MKIKILILFILVFFFSKSFAGNIKEEINIIGSTEGNNTGMGYAGKLVFPSVNGVVVNTINFNSNNNADLQISGNFWLGNLSSSSNLNLGWATFDIGNVSGASKVVLKNNGDNTFTFQGFAWSTAAGWIYFGDTGVANGKVIYNRTTGLIKGCAFGKNIGWLCIDNFILDTTPPDVDSVEWKNFSKAFKANHAKNLTTPEPISYIKIENWASTAQTNYTNSNLTHDFRKVKDYYYEVSDETGNTGTGIFKVVAGEPSDILNSNNIGVTKASEFNMTNGKKIADGKDLFNINFVLRDKYGNKIINEAGVKAVEVNIGFENNVDKDQINDFLNLGDAIKYSDNSNFILNYITNGGVGYNSQANYDINITSVAPTKAGYQYTTDSNDIKLKDLKINIKSLNGNSGVGEGNIPNLFFSKYNEKKFEFTPIVDITQLTNDRNFKIIRDIESSFTGNILIQKTSDSLPVNNIEVIHKIDTQSGGVNKNLNISFQNINSYGNEVCYGFLKPNIDNTAGIYSSSNPECNLEYYPHNNTSNVKILYSGPYNSNFSTIYSTFKATPKVVIAGIPNYDINYSSVIKYDFGSDKISYNSYSNLFKDFIVNNEIKVSGIAHKSEKSFSIISDSSINYIGKIDKMEVYTKIKKNITNYSKFGTGVNGVYYSKGNYELNNWPVNTDSIIIEGGDIVIGGNILKEKGKIKTIVALKDSNTGEGGNIWIKKDVEFVGAVLVTDKSILSGDGNNYYLDNPSNNKQLFIKGSILSFNTIGGSSAGESKCPYYIKESCNYITSKKYDLNNFRNFIYGEGISINGNDFGVDMSIKGYKEAPLIVEYDPELQIIIPKIISDK